MKYEEVIRNFREVYRERIDQYVERYIQQCYIELGKGKRKLIRNSSDCDFFEIDLGDFTTWLRKEIQSIDGKLGRSTVEDIRDIYYTNGMLYTTDEGYRKQEEELPSDLQPSSIHSTCRIYLNQGKILEGALIENIKMLARAVMNGQPIPFKDGDSTIYIGDGEVFYVNPGCLEEPDLSFKGPDARGIFKIPHGVLPITYGEERKSGCDRGDIYRISKDGVTLFLTKTRDGFKKREEITLPLKTDNNGDLQTDLDIFTDAISYPYRRGTVISLNSENAQKLTSTLRGVLEETSSSFVQLETETELRKKVEELQASLDGKETSIAELIATYTDRGERDETSISALREELETGKSKIDTLTSENGRLTEENESLKRTQEEQTAQIQTLQQNNAQLETRAKTAEDNSDSLRQRIEQLKEKVIQAVGKVPFVGKKVKSIFDEDVLALPPQTQKEDDFRARLQVTEPTDDKEIMDEMCKIERRIKEEAQPPMRKRKSHVTQLPMKRRVSEKDDDKFER